MKNDLLILESKLKRHKISYKNENGTIIIGYSKTDYTVLFLMIILPFIIALGTIGVIIKYGIIHRIMLVLLFILFSFMIFNLKRLFVKRKLNVNTKTLGSKTIRIDDENGQKLFYKSNINVIDFSVKEINEDTFEGNLFMIDKDNNKYQILGFDDEVEKYVIDDLKWFRDYLVNHIGHDKID